MIHTRRGAMGYKLEWEGLSMIYTSDTRPERHCIEQAWNGGRGVDVLIHEMALPPEVWAMKNLGLTEPGSGEGWDDIDTRTEIPATRRNGKQNYCENGY